jgi:hypothetical protein
VLELIVLSNSAFAGRVNAINPVHLRRHHLLWVFPVALLPIFVLAPYGH